MMIDRKKEGSWERLSAVIEWASMSINYFARYIGLPRGENLYQIRRGNNGISRDVARRVITRFPEISEAWLLNGSGEMFLKPEERRTYTPFYDVDVEKTLSEDVRVHPTNQITLPLASTCDMAMRYMGLSMAPHIPTGAIVMLSKVPTSDILPNNDYVIKVDGKAILRTVLETDSEDMWHVQAYTPINGHLVAKESITDAWLVRAWIMMTEKFV